MARTNKNMNTAAGTTPKIKFMTPTPGLKDLNLTHVNIKQAEEFGIVRSKLSVHIGSKYKGYMGSKAMEQMAHSTIIEQVEPIR